MVCRFKMRHLSVWAWALIMLLCVAWPQHGMAKDMTQTVVVAASTVKQHGPVSIASNASGRVAMAYVAQELNSAYTIHVKSSSDGGISWIEEDLFAVSSMDLPPRVLVTASGTIHLFYIDIDNSDGSYDLKTKSKTPGNVWTSATLLQTNSVNAKKDLVAEQDAAGNFYLAWSEYNGSNQDVWIKRGLNAGSTWAAAKLGHGNTAFDQTQPALAISESRLVLVMTDSSSAGGNTMIHYIISSDLGATWDTAETHQAHPDATNPNQSQPVIASNGGTTFNLFFRNVTAGNGGAILRKRSDYFGVANVTIISGVEDTSLRQYPAVTSLHDKEMHAFWFDNSGLSGNAAAIRGYDITADGSELSLYRLSSESTNANTMPAATLSALGRNVSIAWLQKAGALGGTIMYARRSLDTTNPTGLTITDDGISQASASSLHATWSATDASGIRSYTYRILEQQEDGSDATLQDWTDAGTNTSVTATFATALKNGYTYFFEVKATDNAFNESGALKSDGIMIDVGLPSKIATITTPAYINSTSTITATWSPSSATGGIASYEMAIGSLGTTTTITDVKNWTDTGTDLEGSITGLKLQAGSFYYVSVRGVNSSGFAGERTTSNPILVDTSAPSKISAVYDDGALTNNATQLRATWEPSTDADSGIASYRLGVGDTGTTANIVPWINVGATTSYVVRDLTLIDGTTYYILVRPVNGAGSTADYTVSDGITLNKNLPDPGGEAIAPVTNLSLTRENLGLSLSWTNPAQNLNAVMILRSADGAISATPVDGVSYRVGARIGNASVVSSSTIISTYTEKDLTPGTRYFYAVYANAPGPIYSAPTLTNGTPLSYPTATATSNVQNGVAPLTVQFSGIGNDTDGSIVHYAWDFNNDGLYEAVSTSGDTSHTFREAGSNTVSLRVTDNDGLSTKASLTIHVSAPTGAPALSSLSASPATGSAPVGIHFSVPTPAMEIATYTWSFGDNTTYVGSTARDVTHVYREPGTYTCHVTATSISGLQATASTSVTITGVPPAVTLAATPASGQAPLTVSFTATAPGADAQVRYEWDFDANGTVDRVTTGNQIGYTYGEAGSWTPRVRIVAPGGISGSATTSVLVEQGSQPPSVFSTAVGPRTGTVPLTVSFTVTANDNTGIKAYQWDYDGDGRVDAITTAPASVYTYTTPGQYHPDLKLVDDSGLVRSVGFGEVLASYPTAPAVRLLMPQKGDVIGGQSTPMVVELISPNGPYSALIEGRLPGSAAWTLLGSSTSPAGSRFTFFCTLISDTGSTALELRARGTDTAGYGATSTVRTVTVGAQDARDFSGTGSAGDRRVVAQAHDGAPLFFPIGSGGAVRFPTGALVGDGTVTGAEYSNSLSSRPYTGRMLVPVAGSVGGVYLAASGVALGADMEVTLLYADADNDGRVDSTSFDETLLRAYWYDEYHGRWAEARRYTVDAQANVVTVSDAEFGAYVLSVNAPTTTPEIDLAGNSVQASIATNGISYMKEDIHQAWLTLNGSGSYDAYICLTIPDGTRYSLQGNGALVYGVVPIARNWTVSPISSWLFMNVTLPDLPLGNYAWIILLTTPNANPGDTSSWALYEATSFSIKERPDVIITPETGEGGGYGL